MVVFEKEQKKECTSLEEIVEFCIVDYITYKPSSLKAKLSVNGIREMIDFAKENTISHDVCGKVVIASSEKSRKSTFRFS